MSPNKIEEFRGFAQKVDRKRTSPSGSFVDMEEYRRNKATKTDDTPDLKPLREYYGIGEPGSSDPGFVYPEFKGDAGKNEKWDELTKQMPTLLKERGAFAKALKSNDLPEFVFEESRYGEKDKAGKFDPDNANLRADLQMLTAISSGYVNYTDHKEGEPVVVPAKLAKPLKKLADMSQVPPMLNYAHYAIDNRKGEIPYKDNGDVDVDKILLQDGDYKWEKVRYESKVPEGGKRPVVTRVTVGTYDNPEGNNAPKKPDPALFRPTEGVEPNPEEDRDVIGQVNKISNIGALKFRYPFVGPNSKGEDDELGFVQVHTAIEAIAATALYAMPEIIKSAKAGDKEGVQEGLQTVADTYNKMEDIFHYSPAYSRVSEYDNKEGALRPYIMGFTQNIRPQGVVYEGEYNNEPQFFRGESGAMSSLIPALDELVGFKPKTDFYSGYRQYMPAKHREFLHDLGEASKGLDLREMGGEAFKEAVRAGANFRKAHADNAMEYLNLGKGVGEVVGTGGSIIGKYLGKNAQEMRDFADNPPENHKAQSRY